MPVDALALVTTKRAGMREAGRQRLALERWWGALPDTPLTKADLQPLINSQLSVLQLLESERYMEIAFLGDRCGDVPKEP